jgi:hypothetical protein
MADVCVRCQHSVAWHNTVQCSGCHTCDGLGAQIQNEATQETQLVSVYVALRVKTDNGRTTSIANWMPATVEQMERWTNLSGDDCDCRILASRS